jgi:PAS domain S-box-containing protein
MGTQPGCSSSRTNMSTLKQSFTTEEQRCLDPELVGRPKMPADSPVSHASILDQPSHSVITTDLQGNITACNQATQQIYGYASRELVGKNVAALHLEDGPDSLPEAIVSAVLRRGQFQEKVRNRTKSGKVIDLSVFLTLLRDGSSNPTGMVRVAFDVNQPTLGESPVAPSAQDARSPSSGSGRAVVVQRDVDGTPFIIASMLMHKFMGMVQRVAGHTETVLITGDTGTGKELIAHTVHDSSYRNSKPFVEINCAALPEHLVESELFGYEKGAFSGADSCKPGLFEMADKGTLFLDEIGELQSHVQVKLLRVLDGSPYYRLGGHRRVEVDVRVIAATNQDLETAVQEGRFRKDLYHRLSQFHLRVPPLRERPEDIAVLARHFLKLKNPGRSFKEEAVRALQSYSWPGNVRELRNVVTKLALNSPNTEVRATEVHQEILQSKNDEPKPDMIATPADLGAMEEQMIVKALERTGGNRSLAAEQLGISRRTLSRKLREYQINTPGRAKNAGLGAISWEQQKSFRASVQFPVTVKNINGDEFQLAAVNLSSRGIGVEGLTSSSQCEGLLDVSFVLPEENVPIHAKARLMWAESRGRAGIKFSAIEPETLGKLQHWANNKMKEEGWELPQ